MGGSTRHGRLVVALLLGVTAVWGSTFVIVKAAVAHMPVMDFLAWRFVVATLVLLPVRPRALATLGWRGVRRGVAIGVVVGGGYVTQTYGLEHVSAAISGFLTGMFVVFTPLIAGVVLRRRIAPVAWVATAVAAGGLCVISLHGFGLGVGEWLTIGCALCFALQLVALGEWSADHDPVALCVVQLATVSVICLVAAARSSLAPPPEGGVWAAVGVTAVIATALAFLVQTWAQAHISPTRAAVVLTMEPVFAGVCALLAGEAVSWRVGVGGLLVLGAMYLVELSPAAPGGRPAAAEPARSAQ